MDAAPLAPLRDTSTLLLVAGVLLTVLAGYNLLVGAYGGVIISSIGAILAFTFAILVERS